MPNSRSTNRCTTGTTSNEAGSVVAKPIGVAWATASRKLPRPVRTEARAFTLAVARGNLVPTIARSVRLCQKQ